MRWAYRFILFAAVVTVNDCVTQSAQGFEWQTASPAEHGFSLELLDKAKEVLADKGTKSLLIVRNDQIVYEWYAAGHGVDKLHYTASLAKAVVGGLSLSLALHDGLIFVDTPACLLIPSWKNDPLKSQITIRHLATHSSGIEDAEQDDIPHADLPGWKGQFWKRIPDPFSISRDFAPVVFTPGSDYAYSNPGMALLAYAVTASLQNSKYKDIRTLLRERIMRPIGINDKEWSIGYETTYDVDSLPLVANWGGGSFTARALARIGRLMLHRGNWDGIQLVDPLWVDRAVSYAGTPLPERSAHQPNPASGLGWWTNFDGVWKQVPRDAFAGAGAGNQVLLVIPSLNLIVVRNGSNLYNPADRETFWGGLETYLFNPILGAMIDPPYPASNRITGITFDPADSVIRLAEGSDNWPITWGDDDVLYTAYGDGWGFDPRTEIKLSLGFAKVFGIPPHVQGTNIRTLSGERVGQGERGQKASGLLMVNGILYAWMRNANFKGEHSQLSWSTDRGNTWRATDWKLTESFGYPTFINFGRDYDGARDEYIYVVSHDHPGAYQPADTMVLARVQKDRILEREAYEFFTGFDSTGTPLWSIDIQRRQPIFTNPAKCYRGGITYNPVLKRYLWCQIHPDSDHPQGPRFSGGFGVYEAPEPWGPWRTVFYTRKWDIGPGETASFPVKWFSEDGTTGFLLFSGNDCFSIRRARFHLP